MTCVSSMREAGHPKTSALGQPRGMGWRGRWEGDSGLGGHMYNLWPIHVDVWQKPSQYCSYSIKLRNLIDLYYQLKLCMNFLKIKQ